MRPLLATVHLDALRHNLRIAKLCAPQSKIMAVVKANAYGHDLSYAARGLADADGFAVLGLNEALVLRAKGYRQTLLLLEGVFTADELEKAAQNHIALVVHSTVQVGMLEYATLSRPVSIFLKMNTGMNRLGFTPTEYEGMLSRLQACQNISDITLMTHFATADEPEGIAEQLALFKAATADMDYPSSLANSAAVLRHPESHTDWVRPGIMLYGASPVLGTHPDLFNLEPAMTLASEIIAVQNLTPGQSVGYGKKFTAEQKTRVGVVACGYADGYPRHAPTGTPAAVAGKLTRTLGRVSMDMLCVDITDISEAEIGSPVELWGKLVSVDEVAESAGTVGYELLCALSPRVPIQVLE
jgi:alanine racemase